jgi:hypothetical protein
MEKCNLCGGEIHACECGACNMVWCKGPDCGIHGVKLLRKTMDAIQSALALQKRIEAGESVEVRHANSGRLVFYADGKPWGCPVHNFSENVRAWNAQEVGP